MTQTGEKSPMVYKPDKVPPVSGGRAARAPYDVTFLNGANISFHLPSAFLSLFSSFSPNLPQQGMGGRGSRKRGMQGLSVSADHQRPGAVADRKETKEQRWRESRCLQL